MKNRNFILGFTLIILLVFSTSVMAIELVYDTTLSPGTTIELPVHGNFHFEAEVDWGDGNSEFPTAYITHTYASEGTYTVITNWISEFGKYGGYDGNEKLIAVNSLLVSSSWLTSLEGAFYGATNLVSVTDIPPSSVTNLARMFYGATSFNQKLNWNVSNVTDMSQMFSGATSFDQGISDWTFRSDVRLFGMFEGVTLSTENYDALLIAFDALTLDKSQYSSVNSKYSPGAAATARQNLIDIDGWTIYDDGLIIPTTVSISISGNDAMLSWDDMGATSYNIYRSTDPYPADWGTAIGTSPVNTYTDVDAALGSKYFYKVTVVD